MKILDFGLAKLTERGEITEEATTRLVMPKTVPGTVLGTAAYMSPEQAEGKPVDARSDIFSFGAVLYEMATGRRAFVGDSQAAILAAVLNKEPRPVREAAPDVPAELDRVITRCLRKEPARRQQDVTDVKLLLEELKEDSKAGDGYGIKRGTAMAVGSGCGGARHRGRLRRFVALAWPPGTAAAPGSTHHLHRKRELSLVFAGRQPDRLLLGWREAGQLGPLRKDDRQRYSAPPDHRCC